MTCLNEEELAVSSGDPRTQAALEGWTGDRLVGPSGQVGVKDRSDSGKGMAGDVTGASPAGASTDCRLNSILTSAESWAPFGPLDEGVARPSDRSNC